ncbi:MAG: alcohol dehydrogenase catalytic domain-containing protein [Anaerolineales bacterium]|nr:alcohol dehydrogenase catalytic domain-containing protein [Anaerolineales bacterium]MCX7609652.1 alcohol dehydrogenase catalytic domain-containing protein [Anaerolineales bacterium]MDW8228146.1 alcohol dehydrogenase catalytic domain-containing protein [Anaerolineales bacterium]
MQAVWLEHQTLSLRALPLPSPDGEALIRICLTGICGTDLELARGYYPFTGIPGHEFVGKVVEAPQVEWIGQRVVGEINAVCGVCEQCRAGRPTHCEQRTVLGIIGRNGTHAEYTRLPLANLHRVPDSIPDEAAVFVEPLAAALEIQQQVQIHPTDRVLLIGAGRLGQLIAQTLALTGCDLRVVARHPRQKDLLHRRGIRLIAEDEILPRRWDVVVEATGSPSGFDLARRALRPRGTLVLKSTYRGEMTLAWSPFVVDEITIIGSRCGPFEPALRLLEQKEVDPTPLLEKRLPLSQALEAYQAAQQPGTLKIVLEV